MSYAIRLSLCEKPVAAEAVLAKACPWRHEDGRNA